MDAFLKQCFPKKEIQIEKLSGDGGHRHYIRVKQAGDLSYILMLSGKKDESLRHFLSIHKRLNQAQCLVPKTFQQDWEEGFLLLEDLGDISLEQLHIQKGWIHSQTFYEQAVEQMLAMQKGVQPHDEDNLFDKNFFLKEIDFSFFHLQAILENPIELEQKQNSALKDLQDILLQIDQAPFSYCHRDFHSKNMMIFKNQLYLLDFQDAGKGPFLYDLTSLLYDSYVPLTENQKQELIKKYFDKAPSIFKQNGQTEKDFFSLIQLQFLQRGLKACACFASFYTKNQKKTHLQYITPTLQQLLKVAKTYSYSGLQDYFHTFLDLWKIEELKIKK